MRPSPILAVLVLLGACSPAGQSRTEAILRARQQATDPLELWSVEVVPAQAGWPAVTVCTNQAIRAGFARPLPAVGALQCDPVEEDARETADFYTVRCDLGGRRFGVSAHITGDRARDFTTHYAVTDLDGFRNPVSRSGSEVEQTRRYRQLGACPAGWVAADSTDRHGVRVRQALVGGGG